MSMKNYIYYRENVKYPKDKFFRPDRKYPEYLFREFGISEESNDIYDMIRDMFIKLSLDKKHIGCVEWNPLGEYILPGNTVLIKPNWVKHENEAFSGSTGMDCLVTNTSIIKCIIDYVLIALKGMGKLIIGDAPVQSCDFEKLKDDMSLYSMEKYYKMAGIDIEFVDLRNYKSRRENGNIVTIPTKSIYKGKEINLGKYSYFYNNCKEDRLRITNYDFRDVNRHHRGNKHEYCISEACLEADVIINLPKPKTHRKAGYTGALKNMVGINAMKDYLPHHTKGSYILGEGDEYYSDSKNAKRRSDINDLIDVLEKKSLYHISKFVRKSTDFLFDIEYNMERYSEGSWWGNNTIWKTILDLNMIVMYADKRGRIKKSKQRNVITIGDLIVAGEKEGPLHPTPKKTNCIIFSDNNVLFDEILVRFMGYNSDKFVILKEAEKNGKLFGENIENCIINSNTEKFRGKLSEFKSVYQFEPSQGWKGYLDKI